MRAITHSEYGSADVLSLDEVEKPTVGDDEALVRVHAAALNPYDWHWMTGLPYMSRAQFGLRKPKLGRLGSDFAGRVEAVGRNVQRFAPGDEVYGGVEIGAFADYVCVAEEAAAAKPANLTFEQAACVPMGALTALQGLRDKGDIEPGQKLLVNGASGGVGAFAVQLGHHFGAHVTGVCSTRNVEMVQSLGADHVVDYTQQDFTRGSERYDLMLDLIGNHSPSSCRRILTRKGTYLASFGRPEHRWFGPVTQLVTAVLMSAFVSQRMLAFVEKSNADDLSMIADLIEAGGITPVVDRTYELEDLTEGMSYLAEGHVRGKVAISIHSEP